MKYSVIIYLASCHPKPVCISIFCQIDKKAWEVQESVRNWAVELGRCMNNRSLPLGRGALYCSSSLLCRVHQWPAGITLLVSELPQPEWRTAAVPPKPNVDAFNSSTAWVMPFQGCDQIKYRETVSKWTAPAPIVWNPGEADANIEQLLTSPKVSSSRWWRTRTLGELFRQA